MFVYVSMQRSENSIDKGAGCRMHGFQTAFKVQLEALCKLYPSTPCALPAHADLFTIVPYNRQEMHRPLGYTPPVRAHPQTNVRWSRFHDGLVAEAADWASARSENRTWHCGDKDAAHGQPRSSKCYAHGAAETGLVLIGDSFVERLRGTALYNRHAKDPRLYGILELRKRWATGSFGLPLFLGASADTSAHLLWRLQNGELTAAMRRDRGIIFALMIGTNDLGDDCRSVERVAHSILGVATYLLESTLGKVLVVGLLPRCRLLCNPEALSHHACTMHAPCIRSLT